MEMSRILWWRLPNSSKTSSNKRRISSSGSERILVRIFKARGASGGLIAVARSSSGERTHQNPAGIRPQRQRKAANSQCVGWLIWKRSFFRVRQETAPPSPKVVLPVLVQQSRPIPAIIDGCKKNIRSELAILCLASGQAMLPSRNVSYGEYPCEARSSTRVAPEPTYFLS